MKKILSILNKNLRILNHTKLSSLILLVGPIIIILILGVSIQSGGVLTVETALYAAEKNNFSDKFVEQLKTKGFIISDKDSLNDCKISVTQGTAQICIEITKSSETGHVDSPLDYTQNVGQEIIVHADYSKQRIVWGILNKIEQTVREISYSAQRSSITYLQSILQNSIKNLEEKEGQLDEVAIALANIGADAKSIESTLKATSTEMKSASFIMKSELLSIRQLAQLSGLMYYEGVEESITRLESVQEKLETQWELYNASSAEDKLDDLPRITSDVRMKILQIKEELQRSKETANEFITYNPDFLINPIPLSYKSISDTDAQKIKDEFTTLDYLYPSFIGFFIILMSIVIGATLTMRERVSNAAVRNALSKAKTATLVIGSYGSLLILVIVQLIIITFLSSYFTTLPLLSQGISLVLPIIAGISCFIFIGISIGYLFDSEETALIAAISLSLLLIIFSPLINPAETIPDIIAIILANTPLVLVEETIRKALIFEIKPTIGATIKLISYGIISFIITYFVVKTKRMIELR